MNGKRRPSAAELREAMTDVLQFRELLEESKAAAADNVPRAEHIKLAKGNLPSCCCIIIMTTAYTTFLA